MPEEKAPENSTAKAATEGEAPVVVRLNPDTGLSGYAFDDGFGVLAGERYLLAQDRYEHYRGVKHNGFGVLVKP